MSEFVRVAIKPGYRIITLDRPDKMNALTPAAIEALIAALGDAEHAEGCRAIVLTGSGRAFCAGADLSGSGPGRDLGAAIERSWNPLARKLHRLAVPIVAAVNGVAAGAGANIALGCDIVLAARSASFIQAFSKIGLIPDAGGTFLLPRLVGEGRARAFAMLAEPVTADRAEAIGMIYRAVDDDSLMAEAEVLAARLAMLPTQSLLLTREAFAASAAQGFDAQLDLERDLQRRAGFTPDFQEGVRAFQEKRRPVFTGKPE